MKPGDELELAVEREASDAVAFVGNRRVFVKGALPGERVLARIGGRTKHGFDARVVSIVDRSPDRREPRCRYFGACGGCNWQHLAYEAQLKWKRDVVVDALGTTDVAPTLPCANEFHYRNKMEFSFGSARWLTEQEIASGDALDRGFALGFFAPGRFDRVLDLHECWLQSARSAELVNRVRAIAQERELPAWNPRRQEGFLRHLVIRQPLHGADATTSPRWMVNLVTSRHDPEALAAFASMLQAEFPEVITFVNTLNTSVVQTAYGEDVRVVFGPGVVFDRIADLRFEIGPHSFFQTNTAQAERLYATAAEFAAIERSDLVFDLYCGVGTIALFVARRAARIVGIELNPGAIENADRNAKLNECENVAFVAGDLLTALPTAVATHGRPDVVIVDPPRAGIHPKALAQLLDLRAPRLVYVSCNPKTLGNDVRVLLRGYRVEAIQPIDLFPQTTHVECVVSLRAIA